ncbi:UNVERIFIED_CONTAM: hypothetical protein RMT77_018168 [Armadillidium vulgare]
MTTQLKFPFLRYDLSEDYIQGAEIVDLQLLSSSVIIGKVFSHPFVLKKVKKIGRLNLEKDTVLVNNLWRVIEDLVIEKTKSIIPHEIFRINVKPVIYVVGRQIYELLKKSVAFFGDESLFLSNLVFNSEGIISTRGTILEILNRSDINVTFKFEIACKYFAGEDIVIRYLQQLPASFVKWVFKYNYFTCGSSCTAIYFWFWHINRKTNILRNIRRRFGIRRMGPHFNIDDTCVRAAEIRIFQWALAIGNETAIQFIYDNFISRYPDEVRILNFQFSVGCKYDYNVTNILLYFSSHMKEREFLPIWFALARFNILKDMIKQVRMHNAFLHLTERLQSKFLYFKFVDLLVEIIIIIYRTALTGNQIRCFIDLLRRYLNYVPHTVLTSFGMQGDKLYFQILEYAFSLKNYELTYLLLGFSRQALIPKELILMQVRDNGDADISLFHMALCTSDTNFIDSILNYYLETKEKRLLVKRWIFDNYAYSACDYYIVTGNLRRLHNFIKWASVFYSEKVSNLKLEIPYKLNKKIIRKILFNLQDENYENNFLKFLKSFNYLNPNVKYFSSMLGKCPFEYTENILFWCLSSVERVSIYKKLICKVDIGCTEQFFYSNIKNWIMNSKFDMVSKLIEWCSTPYEEEITLRSKLEEDPDVANQLCKTNKLRQFSDWLGTHSV